MNNMDNVIPDNIEDVCRLCLKDDDIFLPIFGHEPAKKDGVPLSRRILECVNVEVSGEDDYPKVICLLCLNRINGYHAFKLLCDNSQKRLESWRRQMSVEVSALVWSKEGNDFTEVQYDADDCGSDVILCEEYAVGSSAEISDAPSVPQASPLCEMEYASDTFSHCVTTSSCSSNLSEASVCEDLCHTITNSEIIDHSTSRPDSEPGQTTDTAVAEVVELVSEGTCFQVTSDSLVDITRLEERALVATNSELSISSDDVDNLDTTTEDHKSGLCLEGVGLANGFSTAPENGFQNDHSLYQRTETVNFVEIEYDTQTSGIHSETKVSTTKQICQANHAVAVENHSANKPESCPVFSSNLNIEKSLASVSSNITSVISTQFNTNCLTQTNKSLERIDENISNTCEPSLLVNQSSMDNELIMQPSVTKASAIQNSTLIRPCFMEDSDICKNLDDEPRNKKCLEDTNPLQCKELLQPAVSSHKSFNDVSMQIINEITVSENMRVDCEEGVVTVIDDRELFSHIDVDRLEIVDFGEVHFERDKNGDMGPDQSLMCMPSVVLDEELVSYTVDNVEESDPLDISNEIQSQQTTTTTSSYMYAQTKERLRQSCTLDKEDSRMVKEVQEEQMPDSTVEEIAGPILIQKITTLTTEQESATFAASWSDVPSNPIGIANNMDQFPVFQIKQEPVSDDEACYNTIDLYAVKSEPGLLKLENINDKEAHNELDIRGRVSCEPCGKSFDSYKMYLQHATSAKHHYQLDIAENNERASSHLTKRLNPIANKLKSRIAVTATKLNSQIGVSKSVNSKAFREKSNAPFPCPFSFCTSGFYMKRSLSTHVKTHGLSGKDLDESGYFIKLDETRKHKENVQDLTESESQLADVPSRFNCSYCVKTFISKKSLSHHLDNVHAVKIASQIYCDRCLQVCTSLQSLFNHQSECCFPAPLSTRPLSSPLKVLNLKGKKRKKKTMLSTYKKKSGLKKRRLEENPIQSCNLCGITFQQKLTFEKHMEIYHKGYLVTNEGNDPEPLLSDVINFNHKCEFCNKAFSSNDSLTKHMRVHNNKAFQCKKCPKMLGSIKSFKSHMRSHLIVRTGQFICWLCYKPFNSRSTLVEHKRKRKCVQQIKLKIYSCTLCKHSFNSVDTLDEHKSRVHSNYLAEEDEASTKKGNQTDANKLWCEICDRVFYSIGNLKKHRFTIHNMFLPCRFCKNSPLFASEEAYKEHMLNVHNKKREGKIQTAPVKKRGTSFFRCQHCNKVCSNTSALREHRKFCAIKRTQQSTSVFMSCATCQTTFKNKQSYNRHMNRMHPQLEALLSRKQSKKSADLNMKDNSCTKCGEFFSHLPDFLKHAPECNRVQQLPRSVEWEQCPNCEGQFSTVNDLIKHCETCTNPNLECANCRAGFISPEELEAHRYSCGESSTSVHGGTYAVDEDGFSKCPKCKKDFLSYHGLMTHKKYCKGVRSPNRFSCVKCKRRFKSNKLLKTHNCIAAIPNTTTEKRLFDCPICGKQFNHYSNMLRHKKQCGGIKVSSKPFCVATNELKTDNNKMESGKHFTCSICCKTYYSKSSLYRHECLNKGNLAEYLREIDCSVCSKICVGMSCYYKHRQRCQGGEIAPEDAKGWDCSGCNKCFISRIALIKHRRNCDGIPKESVIVPQAVETVKKKHYQCKSCQKICNNQFNLNTHEKVCAKMFNLPRFDCSYCPRTFAYAKYLGMHMVKHTALDKTTLKETQTATPKRKPSQSTVSATTSLFECDICQKSFSGLRGLHNHRRTHRTEAIKSPVEVDANVFSVDHNAVESMHKLQCTYCPSNFTDSKSLATHISSHKRSLRVSLEALQESNGSEIIVEDLGKTDDSLKCDICLRLFSDAKSLKGHRSWHMRTGAQGEFWSPEDKYSESTHAKCDICGDIIRRNNMTRHKKNIHNSSQVSKGKKENCYICKKAISVKAMNKHMKFHEKKENDINVLKQERVLNLSSEVVPSEDISEEVLQQDIEEVLVDEDEAFPCPFCSRYFDDRAHVSEHLKTDHSEMIMENSLDLPLSIPAHECIPCCKTFSTKGSYDRHVATSGHLKLNADFFS